MGRTPGRPGRRPGRSLVDAGRTVLVVAVVAVAALNGGFDPLLLLSAAGAVAIRWLRIPPVDEVAVVTALVMTGLSSALRLYDSFPVYDHVVHYVFFLLTAVPLYRLTGRLGVLAPLDREGRLNRPGVVLVMAGLALAGGAVWEIFEWSSDSLTGTTFQRGNSDTMADLVVDGLGGLTAGAVWSWRPRRARATSGRR